MIRALFFTITCLTLSQPSGACISVGPSPEVDFEFESDENESLKVIMKTTKGDERESIHLKDDDGYLTSYLIAGYLKNNREDRAQNSTRQHAAWSKQLGRLAEKMESTFYKAAIAKAASERPFNPIPVESSEGYVTQQAAELRKIAAEVMKQKNISEDHLARFYGATRELNRTLSYEIQQRSGATLTEVRSSQFQIHNLPGAITGTHYRGLGCAPGKITSVGIVPLKPTQSSQDQSVPRGFSFGHGSRAGS